MDYIFYFALIVCAPARLCASCSTDTDNPPTVYQQALSKHGLFVKLSRTPQASFAYPVNFSIYASHEDDKGFQFVVDVVLEGIRHQRYSCPESCCSSDTTVAVNFTLKNGSRSVCDRVNILINRTDPVSVIVDLHSFFGEFHFGKTFIIAPERLYISPDFISNGLEKIITVQMRNVSPMECSTESPARGLRISTSLNATITLTNSAFNSSEGISIILTKCLDHSTTQEFTVTVNATKDFIVWAEVIDAVLLPSCQNISGLSDDELALNSLDSLAIGTSTVSVIVLATSLGFCGVAVVLVCFRKVKGHRKTAVHVQVLEKQSRKFLQEMNSTAIASTLRVLGLIPERVKNGIKRSTCREDANECLLTYLKENATKEQVRGVLKCASEKTDYGRMSEFAAKLLQKLPQACPEEAETTDGGECVVAGMNVDDSSTSEIPKLSCHASSTCLKLDKTGVTEESPINLSNERMSVLNEGEDDSIELQSPQEESRRNCAGIATIEFVGTTNCWIQLRSVNTRMDSAACRRGSLGDVSGISSCSNSNDIDMMDNPAYEPIGYADASVSCSCSDFKDVLMMDNPAYKTIGYADNMSAMVWTRRPSPPQSSFCPLPGLPQSEDMEHSTGLPEASNPRHTLQRDRACERGGTLEHVNLDQ